MAFARVNGIVFRCQALELPKGPTLVFTNSLGSDLRIWQEAAPAFTDWPRVIVYHKRGQGVPGGPSEPYSIDEHAEDLIDHLGVERASLVGFQWAA